MAVTATQFPLDLSARLESNHIQNEVQTFSTSAERVFVPHGGPFYSSSLIIRTQDGRDLKPITEYQLLYLHEKATLASNKNVVCVIRILNESIPAVVLNYRVVGGEYADTTQAIRTEIENSAKIAKNVDWHINVFNKPEVYPAAPHRHAANDFTDWDKILVQLEGIRKAIIYGDGPSWESVYSYLDRKVNLLENLSQDIVNGYLNTGMGNALKGYFTKAEVTDAIRTAISNATANLLDPNALAQYYTKSEVTNLINGIKNNIPRVDLSGYYNKAESDKRYVTQELLSRNYWTGAVVQSKITDALAKAGMLSGNDLTQALTSYAKKLDITNGITTALANYYNKSEVDSRIAGAVNKGAYQMLNHANSTTHFNVNSFNLSTLSERNVYITLTGNTTTHIVLTNMNFQAMVPAGNYIGRHFTIYNNTGKELTVTKGNQNVKLPNLSAITVVVRAATDYHLIGGILEQ